MLSSGRSVNGTRVSTRPAASHAAGSRPLARFSTSPLMAMAVIGRSSAARNSRRKPVSTPAR